MLNYIFKMTAYAKKVGGALFVEKTQDKYEDKIPERITATPQDCQV